jgi:hypothetical protein
LYQLQRAFIDFKALNLITSTYSGIDPGKDLEPSRELDQRLEAVKKELNLEGVYEAWSQMKVDPSADQRSSFLWLDYGSKKDKS